MKTINDYFRMLTDAQLNCAFLESEEWRKTGVLKDGVLRDLYESFCAETGAKHLIHLLTEPLLYEVVRRQQDEKQRLCDWLTHFAAGAQREAETQSDRDRAMYADGGAHVARELVRMIQSGRFTKAGVS